MTFCNPIFNLSVHGSFCSNFLSSLSSFSPFLGCQTPSKDDNLEDERLKLLGYGQNIQSDWNINAAEFKKFYPLTHQGSHAFHKNRRKGKRNLPLVDRFVKPSKSASWFVWIFKGAALLKSDHPLQVSTHEQIINDLLNASSGSSSQNEIRVFSFSLFLVRSLFKRQLHLNIYMSHIYIYISFLWF